MGYTDKTILRDKDGHPIPQYYDTRYDEFRPLEGIRSVLYNADLKDYYMFGGMLYRGGRRGITNIGADSDIQYEIQNIPEGELRIVSFDISGTARKYRVDVHEVSKRDIETSVSEGDRTSLDICQLNRVKKIQYAGKFYELSGGGRRTLTDETLTYSRTLILAEESSHLRTFGADIERDILMVLDIQNYNYVIELKNLDTAERMFTTSFVLAELNGEGE